MSVRNIVLYPDDPLTKTAAPVESFDAGLAELVADMFETMETYEGVGLAGPQVGVSKRLLVLRDPESGKEMCLVNPEIAEAEGREEGEEGCLSLPQLFAMVPRATRIQVRAQDIEGNPLEFEACDFLARIIQHETDHLNGTIFLDRLDILTRQVKIAEWEAIRRNLAGAV